MKTFEFNSLNEKEMIDSLLEAAAVKHVNKQSYSKEIEKVRKIAKRKQDVVSICEDIIQCYMKDDDYSISDSTINLCFSEPEKDKNITKDDLVSYANIVLTTSNYIEQWFYIQLIQKNVTCPNVYLFFYHPEQITKLKKNQSPSATEIINAILDYKVILL